eukprot:396433_1
MNTFVATLITIIVVITNASIEDMKQQNGAVTSQPSVTNSPISINLDPVTTFCIGYCLGFCGSLVHPKTNLKCCGALAGSLAFSDVCAAIASSMTDGPGGGMISDLNNRVFIPMTFGIPAGFASGLCLRDLYRQCCQLQPSQQRPLVTAL